MASGFARFRYPDCAPEVLVGFSCKGRGFCPSCCGRRIAELAAHLTDGVLGGLPGRQWVLTLASTCDGQADAEAIALALAGVRTMTVLSFPQSRNV
jgi:hypothetical protein